MTEAEWLACDNPHPMLDFVRESISERKIRLFACACVRQVWKRLDEQDRMNVDLTERYVDRVANATERAEFAVARYLHITFEGPTRELRIHSNAWEATGWWILIALSHGIQLANPEWQTGSDYDRLSAAELRRQADLLRCLLGSPFVTPSLDTQCRTREVVELAWDVYEDRVRPERVLDPGRLGILTDALEDAGCTDDAILSHLRSPGPHVRGCWALDLILGKE
jgi:hypothetical protein